MAQGKKTGACSIFELQGKENSKGTSTEDQNLCVCSAAQSCLILCGPMDCGPPGSSVHGIFLQEYRSGLPFPPPGHLPNPGIEPASSGLAGGFFTTEPAGKPQRGSKESKEK